jgi:hypothetical protein
VVGVRPWGVEHHLSDIRTVELPGPDELWWIGDAGVGAVADVLRRARVGRR